MRIRNGTSNLFVQDKKSVIDYLECRNVINKRYFNFLKSRKFGLLADAWLIISGEPYEITHFLSKSSIMGYDIRKVNQTLSLEGTNEVAIALVSGDDIICYNSQTQKVFLWMIQTGEGKKITISNSLDDFFEMINKEAKNEKHN